MRNCVSIRKCFVIAILFSVNMLLIINLKYKHVHLNKGQVKQLFSNHISFRESKIWIDKSRIISKSTTTTSTIPPENKLSNIVQNILDNHLSKIAKFQSLTQVVKSTQNSSERTTIQGESSTISISETQVEKFVNVSRPWYLENGNLYPTEVKMSNETNKRQTKLFPEEDPTSDRIVNQLLFVPQNYEEIKRSGKLKQIFLYNGIGAWSDAAEGQKVFTKCPVSTCSITADKNSIATADLVIFKDTFSMQELAKNYNQIFMMFLLECPFVSHIFAPPNFFNWSATYRQDSDIVAPYGKWVYHNPNITQVEQSRNYAANKTKKVAWFVSNCGGSSKRLDFARELGKHIQVDIYGSCGNLSCPRFTGGKCFDMLKRDYKFYLSFESSRCKDYITEKLFENALIRDILPIVLGPRGEDYEKVAPAKSFIHVEDYGSPKELAEYLHLLDKNDELYNSYFKWKGTGEFINTFFWCRVCAMLHDESMNSKSYENFQNWWGGEGVCS